MSMLNDFNSYHVILADGSERDIKADRVSTNDGVLTFSRSDDELVTAFAPGSWAFVELERRDDSEEDIDRPDRVEPVK